MAIYSFIAEEQANHSAARNATSCGDPLPVLEMIFGCVAVVG